MYDDEQRSPSLTANQLRKLETADVDRLYTKYLSLRGKSGSLDSSQVSVLRRQLNQARSEARAMRDENSELRKQLTRVRNSRSMKAGKAIGTPVRILRSARRKVTAAGIGKSQVGSRPVKKVAGVEHPGKSNVRQVVDTPVVSTPAVSRVPHSGLADQLRSAWFTQGSITKAYDLVCENEDSFAQGDPVTARLANQVAGEYRFRSVGIEIPVRSAGTAYTPEHDRVLYCVHSTPAYNSNGYSSRTNGVARGMAAAGRDVIVVSRAGYPWDTRTDVPLPTEIRHVEEVEGIDYVHIPGPNLNTDAFDQYVAEATDAFVREATLSRPSLIHAASNYRTALPALVAARRLGLPFVYEVRGLWEITEASKKPGFENTERFAEMRRWETVVATEADQVLAITEGVAEELERRGVPGDKIHVIPNAVDPAEFVPIPRDVRFATGLGLNPDLPTVGFAGSMVSYEGLDVLIEASTRLNEEGVLHQLALAGSGDDERRLRTLSHGQEHIHFLGRLPQGDVIRLLSFIDVVACPRRKTVVTELVSALKPLESFSMSTATVLSDVAPNLTLAGDPDQPRAMVVEADNAQDLARGLRTLISDEDLRRDIGETGRLWVVRERNWSTIGLKIAGAHRRAMATYKARQHTGPKLADLKVGVIADEFTREGLSETFRTVAISRDSWAEQLKDSQLDMMFVESAWEGNGGEWHHGVGYYGEKENADLFALLDACQEANIPTVFWNKEDPVHYARFAPTAARFDHVFTTDAKMISRYWTQRDNRNLTVSSHSFYAQPRIHNPLPSPRAFSPTVAYAGTYYGDRYPDRTVRLEALLEAARVHGLDIYDRQADLLDSPYRFPVDLQDSVRGALTYREVVDSYKAHLAHINVNSVEDSPSMFSRRVVEIPACGGILMSADGRGISETMGSVLATSNDSQMYSAWLHDWSTDPESWLRERWLQLRAVMRSHTSTTALSVLARTAGIPVSVPGLPPYAISVEKLDERLATEITRQSVRPKAVISEYTDDEAGAVLARAGIDVYENLEEAPGIEWSGRYFPSASRTHYEDLLTATNYGSWKYLDARIGEMREHSTPMADPQTGGAGEWALHRTGVVEAQQGLILRFPSPTSDKDDFSENVAGLVDERLPRILVAGHDLKFIAGFLDLLRSKGYTVDTDEWSSHAGHDEVESEKKLELADVILCEWGLGNAVWYSRRVKPGQKLFVRVHSQELFRPFLSQINHESVEAYVFVGELIRKAAVLSHGVPEAKTLVIPNAVATRSLNLEKTPHAARTLGLVGIVPRSKRFDRALDLLERLQAVEPSWRMRVKGKKPEDYPWMQNRPEELAWFNMQMSRVKDINERRPGSIIFDGFSNDMPDWYRGVGVALSTSDFESFHLTIPDGAASGAHPASLNWPGADLIYPESWLAGSIEELADRILQASYKSQHSASLRHQVSHFDEMVVYRNLEETLTQVNPENVGNSKWTARK